MEMFTCPILNVTQSKSCLYYLIFIIFVLLNLVTREAKVIHGGQGEGKVVLKF